MVYSTVSQTRPTCQSLSVNTPAGRRWVGQIDGQVLKKRVAGSRHLMRTLDAWGFQVEAVEEAQRKGIKVVKVEDTESGVVYKVSLNLLYQKGIRRDFGHGMQVFLPRRLWDREAVGQHQLTLWVGGVQ